MLYIHSAYSTKEYFSIYRDMRVQNVLSKAAKNIITIGSYLFDINYDLILHKNNDTNTVCFSHWPTITYPSQV